MVYFTSLKSVICDVIKEDESPYSDFHPEENVNCIFTPLSIVSRMTMDLYFSLFSNKALIELKKQFLEIMK